MKPEPSISDFPRPPRLWLAYLVYQLAAHLALPFAILLILWRSRKEPLYRARFAERLGYCPEIRPGSVWIFAASLGETRAVSPLIRALLEMGQQVLLTHSSPAGLIEGRNLFAGEIAAGQIVQAYVPADLFWAVRRFLRRTRPALGLVVESEIWPAMLFEAARNGTAMVHVNGNYLEQSFQRDKRRFGGVRLGLFRGFAHILTKSKAHVTRYLGAGVLAERVHLVGELKFDQTIDANQIARAKALKSGWPTAQKVLLIASSVEGEEEALHGLMREVLEQLPDTLIIWVPRSPQRFGAITERMEAEGWKVARRSTCLDKDLKGALTKGTRVLVGDSLGEMAFYNQLADLVFVGASLNGHGGHNIIESLALGKPVVMGPSIYGIEFPAYEAQKAGCFDSLPDVAAVTRRLSDLLTDAKALQQMTRNAADFCAFHKGATQASMALITPYLKPEITLRAARPNDVEFVWACRNDRLARDMSGDSAPIDLEDHRLWFAKAISNPSREILVAELAGERLGYVRFDLLPDKDIAIISIALAACARGQGHAKPMLQTALKNCRFHPGKFRAIIRKNNAASLAIFTSLGFQPTTLETYELTYD